MLGFNNSDRGCNMCCLASALGEEDCRSAPAPGHFIITRTATVSLLLWFPPRFLVASNLIARYNKTVYISWVSGLLRISKSNFWSVSKGITIPAESQIKVERSKLWNGQKMHHLSYRVHCTEPCKNIPVRFWEWLAEILRHSAFLGWAAEHFDSLRVILKT